MIYTKESIIRQLKAMNAPQDSIVLMHSSLRCIGKVEGGGESLLDILVEYFTEQGGLFCVPVHTVENFLEGKEITLDMTNPQNDLGAFSTIALKSGKGVRSENPVLSVVVFGDKEKSKKFVEEDNFITTPTAPESCYGKLASPPGYVLLVGVGQEKNTYLHCIGEMLNLPDRMDDVEKRVTVKRPNGEIVERKIRMYRCSSVHDVSKRFPKYETAFRYHGCIRDGFIGNAPTQLCDAVKLKNTVSLIIKNANGKDPLSDEVPIPPKWFCTN